MSSGKIACGYYIKSRKIKNSPVHKMPPHVREIWDYCLREANYCDAKYGPFTVKRGQLFRTYKEIRDDLCWYIGYRKMVYNENQTKHAMKALRDALMITTSKELGGVLITVLNYDFYQDPKNYESTDESTDEDTNESTIKEPSSTANNKKNKKNKNKNTYSNEFESVWKIAPKRNGVKQGKNPASVLFEKLSIEDKRKVYVGLKNYSEFLNLPSTTQSAMDLERFIRNRIFDDYQEKVEPDNSSQSGSDAARERMLKTQKDLYDD